MNDDDKKTTEGTGEEASNGADKATDAATVADILKHIGGSQSDAWNEYIGSQALASIQPYRGDEEKTKLRAIVVAGLNGIAPRDEMEGMIAAQMLAIHDTAMACFRYALAANKPSGLFRDYLNQAGKLSRTFAMLLDALNRHRGRGMQKIMVEHVDVHTGGQAVVGTVEAPGGGVQSKSKGQAHAREILGATLSRAAKAIASKVQVPPAMAAQSVLAAASLAACTHADVMLPYGQARPLSLFFATVAASRDRKSTSDREALWPVRKREEFLRERQIEEMQDWKHASAAWAAEKRKIEGDRKIGFQERKSRLVLLGGEPIKPLSAFLTTGDMTIEGLVKNWPDAHAVLGLFTAEGGMFTAGHGMNDDNRLKTAAMLCGTACP